MPRSIQILAVFVVMLTRVWAEDTWAFTPAKDEFSDQAALDLRQLNEHEAGEHGFVRLSADGNDLVLGDGTPARFWAVNDAAYRARPDKSSPDLARNARFLAKRGVNMVRYFQDVEAAHGDDPATINEAERDGLWRTVAAMRKEGIYTLFCPYWSSASHVLVDPDGSLRVLDDKAVKQLTKDNQRSGKAGYTGKPFGMLFYDRKLQAAYRQWMKSCLCETNPYTGIALAQDPALAIIQIQNEDSLLWFSSLNNLAGEPAQQLGRLFATFVAAEYGSAAKAIEAWKGATVTGDDRAGEVLAPMPMWDLLKLGDAGEGMDLRRADQVAFLAQTMRTFNQETADYLRKDLGCKQLINAGNWKTADNVKLNDAERYSYGPAEVMAVNRYYSRPHIGKYNGWAIVDGDVFSDDSVLLRPREFPLTIKQVAGHPMLITESSWVAPLGYQSEGPFLVAAYSCLTGLDSYFWFIDIDEDWRQPGSANGGYLPSVGKWYCSTPMLMGQWPAAAWVFRKALVRQGAPAVVEQRALDDMWRMRTPLLPEDPGYDPFRDREQGNEAKLSDGKTAVDPLAYLVGPVSVSYGGDPATSVVEPDLGKRIDRTGDLVVSNTDELAWDSRIGICTVDAPMAQGASGFLAARKSIQLRDLGIVASNAYATVLAVALDGKPLAASGRVLVQVGTTERPTGWKTKPGSVQGKHGKVEGLEVVDFGKAPWRIVAAELELTLANPTLRKLRTLDPNFMETASADLARDGGKVRFAFPKDALYALLTAE